MIRSHRSTPFRTLAGLLVVFFLLSLSGCDYLKFVGQKRTLKNEFHNHPKMELLRELSPENCYTLFGEIDHPKDYDGSFLVVGVSDRYQNREIVAKRVVLSPALFYSVMGPTLRLDLDHPQKADFPLAVGGTITLRSQLDDRIYMKAVKTYGFDATHVGILNDESVRKVFNEILETVAP